MKEKLALSAEFISAFARQSQPIQQKLRAFLTKMQTCPWTAEIRAERIPDAPGIWQFGIPVDEDYVCIMARQTGGEGRMALWVDHREHALAWARTHCCEIHPRTGSLQLFELRQPLRDPSEPGFVPLFPEISRAQLLLLGVPDLQVPFVQSMKTREDLYSARSSMPAEAYETLVWLLDGFEPDEIRFQVHGQVREAPDHIPLRQSLLRPGTQRSFVVAETDAELQRILDEPPVPWIRFLSPIQRRVVIHSYSGTAQLRGAAGTGKTVVTLMRAKALAQRLSPGKKLLFATLSEGMTAEVRDKLRILCTPEEYSRIEVSTLTAWAKTYLKERGSNMEIRDDESIVQLWRDAVKFGKADLPFPVSFYPEEWRQTVITLGVTSESMYLKAERGGSGTPLTRSFRMEVWKVFTCFEQLCKERGIWDENTCLFECSRMIKEEPVPRYAHIIADEAQEFSNGAFHLMRALTGRPHADDIFLTGDCYQRVDRNGNIIPRIKVRLVGRSNIFHVNYRNTEKERRYAMPVMRGDMAEVKDERTGLGELSRGLSEGQRPTVTCFPDASGEIGFLQEQIRALQNEGVSLAEICVISRYGDQLAELCDSMRDAGFECTPIPEDDKDDRTLPGLRFATMQRSRGTEFDYVFVTGVGQKNFPPESQFSIMDDVLSPEERELAERRLLYVSLTRARKRTWITAVGRPSRLLPEPRR